MAAGLGPLAASARRRAGWFVRDHLPDRPVVRTVQGVRMVLPRSHRLPDYVAAGPAYGQNLVELARLLGEHTRPLPVLDIGANVGDSTLQILAATDARVLCVEGDRAYLRYLHLNIDGDSRAVVVEALLSVEDDGASRTAIRRGGTTRFAEGSSADALPSVSVRALRADNAGFGGLRLVKSDTDGYDVQLVPAVARAWADVRPVLFFEYDPYLIKLAGLDPLAVWPQLADLGYADVAVWDHGGTGLGRAGVADIAAKAACLEEIPGGRPAARTYWDVALAHTDDRAGLSALDALVPPSQRL